VALAQCIRIETIVLWRGGRRQQTDVRFGQQILDLLPVGGLARIEVDRALIDIEGTPARLAAIGSGRVELDDVGPKVGEYPPEYRPTAWSSQPGRRQIDPHRLARRGRVLLAHRLVHVDTTPLKASPADHLSSLSLLCLGRF
jgi:hypothetical protein